MFTEVVAEVVRLFANRVHESSLVLSEAALKLLGRGRVEGGGDIHPLTKTLPEERFRVQNTSAPGAVERLVISEMNTFHT